MIDRRRWQIAFLQQARSDYNLQKQLRINKLQLRADFKRLLPLADEIERLVPALAQDGPNPEYPWIDKADQVFIPRDYSFPLINLLQSHQGVKLLKYIEYSLEEFEKLFLG